MNTTAADRIAKAVLYEGYMLYPYRPSVVKNQQRFNFGVVYPQMFSEAQKGTDPWIMRTECLLHGNLKSKLEVQVRFLQLVERSVEKLTQSPLAAPPHAFSPVRSLTVDDRSFHSWQEAVECQVDVAPTDLATLIRHPVQRPFSLAASKTNEPIRDDRGTLHGRIVRSQHAIDGSVYVAAHPVSDNAFKIAVRVRNVTRTDDTATITRDYALTRSLVSAHVVLGVERGEFVSLLDPPDALTTAAADCHNQGVYPVLVGEEGQRDTILASPIILYDYPQIAPESAGDLFDGTEIDEILSLRIMTMTDEEKREMRESDDRARQMLERTENMPAEQFMKLHGALRGLKPVKEETSVNEWEWQLLEDKSSVAQVEVGGVAIHVGDRVRLRPRAGGDVFDLALAGQLATIESLEQDYENKVHVCVVLDDDPGRDLGLMRQPGHRFFFAAEEIELLPPAEQTQKTVVVRPSILVAGIGNIFMGDDAFGVEVARRLMQCELPAEVQVGDYGIRGFDLAYALQDNYNTTILIDAYPHGDEPGTLYVVEPDLASLNEAQAEGAAVDAHGMDPVQILKLAASMGGPLKRILLVGCEPLTLGPEEGLMGLSEPVGKAIDEAVNLVELVIKRVLSGDWPGSQTKPVS